MNTSTTVPAPPLRILVCGQYPEINLTLAGWLSELEDMVVINTRTNTLDALVMARKMQANVALLDFEMDGVMLPHTISLFKMISPATAIIVLAQKLTPVIQRRCKDLGAVYVFEKSTDLEQLAGALQAVRDKLLIGKPLDQNL